MSGPLKYLVFFLFISNSKFCFSQQTTIDSLLHLIKKEKADTNKVKHLNDIAWELMESNPDSAITYANEALLLAKRLNWEKAFGETLRNLGTCNFLKADYPKALEFYLKALSVDEKIINKKGMASDLANIGLVYKNQDEYEKAITYYQKALKIDEEIGSKKGMAADLGNIGTAYKSLKNYSKALEHHQKALLIYQELKNKRGMAINYGSIGNIYKSTAEHEKALENYFSSLKLYEELDNKNGIVINLTNIGIVYTKQKKNKESEQFLLKAIQISKEIGLTKQTMEAEESLSELYTQSNKFDLALLHYKNAMILKDNLFNEEKNNELVRKEMTFEFEKKEAAVKAEQDKKDIITKEALKQKEKERNYFIIGFSLLAIFAFILFRGYKQKQKANELITFQKQLLEQKQKEIIDSIEYAKRIQLSILPNENYIHKNIKRLNKKA